MQFHLIRWDDFPAYADDILYRKRCGKQKNRQQISRQFLINMVADPVPGRMSVCLNRRRLMRRLRGIDGERSTSQGVVAGTETLCRAHDGATGGRAPTYCWRRRLRGSEGAPAIFTNPLRIVQIAYTGFSLNFLHCQSSNSSRCKESHNPPWRAGLLW